MKIFLYSNQTTEQTSSIDTFLFDTIKDDDIRLAYIPSEYEGSEKYYPQIKEYYSSLGAKEFVFFPLEQPHSEDDLEEVLESEIIYLSGGNAFYFLQNMKRYGFDKHLREYAKNGGIILGVSAGANILTPTIVTATIPHDKIDKNEVKLTDLKALELVDFEFAPHYDQSGVFLQELLNYSNQTENVIYGVPDGSGIGVFDGEIRYFGSMIKVHMGKVEEIQKF